MTETPAASRSRGFQSVKKAGNRQKASKPKASRKTFPVGEGGPLAVDEVKKKVLLRKAF